MKEERQVFYLSAVKKEIGKEESVGILGKGIFAVSCLFEIAWSDKRNCTFTETTETQHALCLKYIPGLNLKTGQRSVIVVWSDKDKITFKALEKQRYGLRETVSKHLKSENWAT